MEKIKETVNNISDNSTIDLIDIPDIDLYMDQVIQLFDNKLNKFKRNEEEKILTKTMINNYVKGKLLMPVNKKKYSKEHILLISMIYELKGILSINDIQKLLEPIVEDIKDEKDKYNLESIYNEINTFREKKSLAFKEEVKILLEEFNNMNIVDDYEKKLILINNLAIKSNMYRRLSESIIDDLMKKM